MDFFIGGEVTSSRLNLSLDVGNFAHVFNQWDWCVGKGDDVVKHIGLLSFKNYSLVIGPSETCRYCATCCCCAPGALSWSVI
jgi:hypothetical protein